ncbi:hypothetical protein SHL15_7999 [Streptomyces hygroscopicus subsp. limoneus]|nr:hypothetical protein SHL15_7999 [Streptomyces hygroscopicus subsp. limoneus]
MFTIRSYASCPLDGVDWSPFDIVGLDAFRSLRSAAPHRNDLRKEFTHGKPVAIMEVGCCTFRGAGDYGGSGWYTAMEPDGVTPKPHLVRDESEQVRYLDELITVFGDEGVDCLLGGSASPATALPTVCPDRPTGLGFLVVFWCPPSHGLGYAHTFVRRTLVHTIVTDRTLLP